MSNLVRITKYLAECGECARRGAEEIIREGRVRINGYQVKDLNVQVRVGADHVQVGNKTVKMPEKGVILLNKPRGVVSTLADPENRKTVSDYLTKHQSSYFPVGRLDYDSSGLLILTNDGELANRLMHPRYGFIRVYEVRVRGAVTEKTLRRLTSGLKIDEDSFVKAVNIRIDESSEGETSMTISVGEGKNRMVRRMFDAVGHPVMRLKRTKHGPVSLGGLAGGQIKKLTLEEYKALRKKIFEPDSDKKEAKSKVPTGVLPMVKKEKTKRPKRLVGVRRRVRD